MVPKHPLQKLALALWITLLCWSSGLVASAAELPNEEIRRRFEAYTAEFPVTAGEQPLLAVDALMQFYEERRFELAWFKNNRLRPEAKDLLRTIDRSAGEGLSPPDYHQHTIARLIEELDPSSPLATQIDLDLLLSDAFLLLGSHLLAGKVNPVTITSEWSANRRGLDMAPLLAQALETGSVEAMLDTLRPSQPTYLQMREERKRLAALLPKEWTTIPSGPLIRPNDKDARLPQIRARLMELGDHAGPGIQNAGANTLAVTDDTIYNIELLAAVSRFQSRHGLKPDGVIGPGTLASLNLTPSERLRQVELNMERWRWLPEQLGSPHIMVNMAGAEIQVVVDRQPIRKKQLTVGAECRNTPPFSDEVRYLVFNPSWTVPPTLAMRESLAELTDPARLDAMGFKIYTGWGTHQSEVNPAAVNWASAFAAGSPYRFIQEPGPHNVLGKVKIVFPNEHGLYLHDAPSQDTPAAEPLFGHGCVRVEGLLDLADVLLGEDQGWSRKHARTIAPDQPNTRYLQEPVRIHVQYLTNWTDENGILQVRKDILGRDRSLANAIAEAPR